MVLLFDEEGWLVGWLVGWSACPLAPPATQYLIAEADNVIKHGSNFSFLSLIRCIELSTLLVYIFIWLSKLRLAGRVALLGIKLKFFVLICQIVFFLFWQNFLFRMFVRNVLANDQDDLCFQKYRKHKKNLVIMHQM